MINIRFAEPKDIDIIFNFILELSIYENLEHAFTKNKEDLNKYLFGNKKFAEVLIAEYNEVPVGFALFFTNFSTFECKPGIYLEDLFVLENFRNKGIGKTLLKELANIVISRNYGRLEWTVLDWNPARKFYENIGAKYLNDWLIYRLKGEELLNFAKKE
jgi:GNAT superfamily N-acetyltransferase